MHAQGIPAFPYYLGIDSLADVATRGDRVCVLNILGGESRQVTPTSHAFSGGNVVFGTSPGRGGQVLKTADRRHPGLQQRARRPGRRPCLQHRRRLSAAVGRARRRGRADPRQPGPEEDRHRHREDRGARRARDPRDGAGRTASTSSAATASAWPTPGTACASAARSAATTRRRRCCRARSRSSRTPGGFTTTIAQYLATEGWGTTTLVSSGKDVYIHYARPRLRARAAQRRPLARRGALRRARRLLRARTSTSASRSWPASSGAGSPS